MATREEVQSNASLHSLPSRTKSSLSRVENGDADENESVMRDMLEAGIIDEREFAFMRGQASTKDGGMGDSLDIDHDDLLQQADVLEDEELMGTVGFDLNTLPAEGLAETVDPTTFSLSDSALNFPEKKPFVVPTVNQEAYLPHAEAEEVDTGAMEAEVEEDGEELHVIKPKTGARHLPPPPRSTLVEEVQQEEAGEEEGDMDEQYYSGGESESSGERGAYSYQHELAKPRFSVGKQKVTIAEAALFGLVDKAGNLRLSSRSASPTRGAKEMRERAERLSVPRTVAPAKGSNQGNGGGLEYDGDDDEQRNMTFQPRRSPEAIAAMKNKRCGYDFMDRLNNRGNFLDRVTPDVGSKKKKLSQSQYDALKQDYDAKLDKLQCPKCHRAQTFDEHCENRRVCTSCKAKFEKLNVTSGLRFLRELKEKEARRVEKLKQVEREMYGADGKSTVINKVAGPDSDRKKSKEKETVSLPRIRPTSSPPERSNPAPRPSSSHAPQSVMPSAIPGAGDMAPRPPSAATKRTTQRLPAERPASMPSHSGVNSQAMAVEKMVSLSNQQSAQVSRALEGFAQYPHIGVTVDGAPSLPTAGKQSSAPPTSSRAKPPPAVPASSALEMKTRRLVGL